MTVPQNKDQLLDAINSTFDRLIEDLNSIPAQRATERTLEGHVKGTRMSLCDLVAYLVGWNELVLKWIDRSAAGQPIDYPDTGFKGNELGQLAQKFYRDYEGIAYGHLLERLCVAKGRIVSFIQNQSTADLYEHPWYDRWTLGRMIQFNTSSPYANARKRLRRWLNNF